MVTKTVWWVVERISGDKTERQFKSRNGAWAGQYCQRKSALMPNQSYHLRPAYLNEDLSNLPTMGATVIVGTDSKTAN